MVLQVGDSIVTPWVAARLVQYLYTNQYSVTLNDDQVEPDDDQYQPGSAPQEAVELKILKTLPLVDLVGKVSGYLTDEVKQAEAGRNVFDIDQEMWGVAAYYRILPLMEYIADKYTTELQSMRKRGTRWDRWRSFLLAMSLIVGSFHMLPDATSNMCDELMHLRLSGTNDEGVNHKRETISIFDPRNTVCYAKSGRSWQFPEASDPQQSLRKSISVSPRKRKRFTSPVSSDEEEEAVEEDDDDDGSRSVSKSKRTTKSGAGYNAQTPSREKDDALEEVGSPYTGPSLEELFKQDAYFVTEYLMRREISDNHMMENTWTSRKRLFISSGFNKNLPRHLQEDDPFVTVNDADVRDNTRR